MHAGADVFRINLSHTKIEDAKKVIDLVRSTEKKVGRPVAVMLDLQGQKIRVGKIKENTFLSKNSTLILTDKLVLGDNTKIQIQQKDLIKKLNIGKKISIDDGKIVLKIESKSLKTTN